MFLLKLRVTLPDVWNIRFSHVVFNHPLWMHCSSILAQHPTISSVCWQTSTLTSTSLKISDLKQPWLSPCYGHAYLTCLEEDTWWDTFVSVQCFICLSLNKKNLRNLNLSFYLPKNQIRILTLKGSEETTWWCDVLSGKTSQSAEFLNCLLKASACLFSGWKPMVLMLCKHCYSVTFEYSRETS